jgi:hypothetical protein
MNPATHLVAHSSGWQSANPIWWMILAFLIGALFMFLVMRAKPGRRAGFAILFFAVMVSIFAPGMNAQTAHFITLTWNYTQGVTPAASFLMQRGSAAGGPYATIQALTLTAVCTAVAGQAGSFTCTANDTAALAAGTVSHYVVVAEDGSTPPNQSGPSNDVFAAWLGNPLAASGAAATSH